MDSPLRERIAQATVDAAYGGTGHHEDIEHWLHVADAAYATLTLSDHIAAVEASGLVCVPAEPTGAMIEAGVDVWCTLPGSDADQSKQHYRAMLAARPRDAK